MPTTVQAPEGAEWAYEELKTDKGTKSLGSDNPILVWKDLEKMREFYGDEGVLAIADGTSLRVSFQNIGRRMRSNEKNTIDDIAKAQVEFRPGKRVVGESTPASRSARAAKQAVESGAIAEDDLAKLLEAVKSGKLKADDITALTAS